MAREFNGTTQYLSAASTLLSNEPIDMVAFFNSDTAANTQVLLCLGDGGSTAGHFEMRAAGAVASDPVQASKNDDAGTGVVTASTGAGYSINTWHVGSVSHIANNSRAAWIDGANKGTDTTIRADPTPNFVSIGAAVRSAVSLYTDGEIAEAYILDTNMADAEHATAGLGVSPFWLVPMANIRAWYPLRANDKNRVANGYPDLTATNSPTETAHPVVRMYPRINGVITF